jgi:hypothetical protein
MREINLSETTPSLQELLQLAVAGNLILKTGDGKEFLLAEIDDFDREIALVRQQPELIAFLEQRSKATRTYTMNEAREALGLK